MVLLVLILPNLFSESFNIIIEFSELDSVHLTTSIMIDLIPDVVQFFLGIALNGKVLASISELFLGDPSLTLSVILGHLAVHANVVSSNGMMSSAEGLGGPDSGASSVAYWSKVSDHSRLTSDVASSSVSLASSVSSVASSIGVTNWGSSVGIGGSHRGKIISGCGVGGSSIRGDWLLLLDIGSLDSTSAIDVRYLVDVYVTLRVFKLGGIKGFELIKVESEGVVVVIDFVHFECFDESVIEAKGLAGVEEFLGVKVSLVTLIATVESLFGNFVFFW
jgi:hypothetical protein